MTKQRRLGGGPLPHPTSFVRLPHIWQDAKPHKETVNLRAANCRCCVRHRKNEWLILLNVLLRQRAKKSRLTAGGIRSQYGSAPPEIICTWVPACVRLGFVVCKKKKDVLCAACWCSHNVDPQHWRLIIGDYIEKESGPGYFMVGNFY